MFTVPIIYKVYKIRKHASIVFEKEAMVLASQLPEACFDFLRDSGAEGFISRLAQESGSPTCVLCQAMRGKEPLAGRPLSSAAAAAPFIDGNERKIIKVGIRMNNLQSFGP